MTSTGWTTAVTASPAAMAESSSTAAGWACPQPPCPSFSPCPCLRCWPRCCSRALTPSNTASWMAEATAILSMLRRAPRYSPDTPAGTGWGWGWGWAGQQVASEVAWQLCCNSRGLRPKQAHLLPSRCWTARGAGLSRAAAPPPLLLLLLSPLPHRRRARRRPPQPRPWLPPACASLQAERGFLWQHRPCQPQRPPAGWCQSRPSHAAPGVPPATS